MAWIKSYQEIERHPKTIILMGKMGWDTDITIAKLHRLWWWCADYAYDGDISRHTPETIAAAVGLPQSQGKAFIEALTVAGFVDRRPVLRLHDWWGHFGDFLRGKFARSPEKWQAIEKCYTNASKALAKHYTLNKVNKVNKEKIEETNKRAVFTAPTLTDIQAYCMERGNTVNPDRFMAHYEANGWLVGKNRMKDWKAAIRTWEHSDFNTVVPIKKITSDMIICNLWKGKICTAPDQICIKKNPIYENGNCYIKG